MAEKDKEVLKNSQAGGCSADWAGSKLFFSLGIWNYVLIACVCLLLYAPVVSAPWISDDTRFITSNSAVKSLSHTADFFLNPKGTTASTAGYEGIYRPLRTLSFAVDYAVWGLKPLGFHLTNIFLHIVASILIFLICQKMNFSRNAAFFAALVFASHPAQVEAVTWISSRADGMAAVFLYISFLLFLYSRTGRKSWWYFSGAWIAFVLALLSKEAAIVLPLLFVAYDLFLDRRGDRNLKALVVRYGVFFGTAAVYFVARMFVLGQVAQQGYWYSLPVTLLTMARCFWIYLKLLFLPSAGSCLDYVVPLSKPPFTFAIFLPILAATLLVLASMVVLCVFPTIGFGFLWFLVALAPVSNIIPMSMLMGERFLYIPLAGICIACAAFLDRFCLKKRLFRQFLNGCLCITIIVLGFLTSIKNQTWRNPELLWTQSLERYPDSYRARMGLATALYENGQTTEAIKQYGYALRLFPNMQVLHDMGNAYRQTGDYSSAVAAYRSALALEPTSSWTRTSLAITFLLQGKTEEAIEELQHAIRLENNYWIAHYYLGLAFEEKGETGAALQELKIALSYAPERKQIRTKIDDIERRLWKGTKKEN